LSAGRRSASAIGYWPAEGTERCRRSPEALKPLYRSIEGGIVELNAGDINTRKGYIRSIVDAVEVDDRAIQIIGSKGHPSGRRRRQTDRKQKFSLVYTQMARQTWLLDEFDVHVCEIGEIPPSDGSNPPELPELKPG
jgi:hypothetical protein